MMKPMHPALGRLLATLVLTGVLLGCASPAGVDGPAPAGGNGWFTPSSGDFPVRPAADLLPDEEVQGAFSLTRGGGEPQTLSFTLTPTADGEWLWSVPGFRENRWVRTDTGAIAVAYVKDFREGVKVTYEPALDFLPARITEGAEVSAEVEMKVTNLSDGSPRDQGRCSATTRVLGHGRTRLEAGGYEVYRIEQHRSIDLHLADVEVTIETLFAPAQGPVGEKVKRRLKVLGLFGGTTTHRLERSE